MKIIGNSLMMLLIAAFIVAASTASAGVTAVLDRDKIALGDTLRLTVTATGDEELSDADLRPLLKDFEILQRSTSSNTSISNGRRSHTRQLLLDITPLRQGQLAIPPLHIGNSKTAGLSVSVAPPPDIDSGGQTVLFEAELDRQSVYVQGQVILTLRLQQSINLDGRSNSKLELDDAFVRELEQQTFQRTINGKPWLVNEVRYAIFPEHSGSLEIPSMAFSGRLREGRRNLLGFGGSGRLLRRNTEPLRIKVLPRPDNYTEDNWLPARQITLEEHWSTPPDQLRAGESATRTISVIGEGLQGAQLPPVLFTPADGLKFYPDQPQISDSEVSSGLLGSRRDSAAVVPTSAGTWHIPEIRVPWWDTESDQLRYAVVTGRDITVSPAEVSTSSSPQVSTTATAGGLPSAAQLASGSSLTWQIIGFTSTVGWILTLIYLWRSRRHIRSPATASSESLQEKQALRRLSTACSNGDSKAARETLISWASALSGDESVVSLEKVMALLQDEQLEQELQQLERHLYSPAQQDWSGSELEKTVQRLRKAYRTRQANNPGTLQLYPAG